MKRERASPGVPAAGQASEKPETVLLIHGTFAAPQEGGPLQWWQPGSPFCRELDTRLQQLGSPARCWAHGTPPLYHWSGKNSWLERARAAADLAQHLRMLRQAGWRCHLVAHSHGGMVLLQAIESLSDLGIDDWTQGSLVTLGTPFLDTYRPRRLHDSKRLDLALSLLVIAVLAWLVSASVPLPALPQHWLTWLLVGIVLVVVFILVLAHSFMIGFGRGTARYEPEYDRLLVLFSQQDEAFQLLSRVINLENPFRPKPATSWVTTFHTWWSGVAETLRSADRLRFPGKQTAFVLFLVALLIVLLLLTPVVPPELIEFLRGATWVLIGGLAIHTVFDASSVLAALCIPVRLGRLLGGFLASGVMEMGFWMMRHQVWGFLTKFVLGLNGYPFPSAVSLTPKDLPAVFYHAVALSPAAEQRALRQRERSFSSTYSIISNALARPALSMLETEAILSAIASDTHLIHAAYYTDPGCLDPIAAWIARTEADIADSAAKRGRLL